MDRREFSQLVRGFRAIAQRKQQVTFVPPERRAYYALIGIPVDAAGYSRKQRPSKGRARAASMRPSLPWAVRS